MDPTNGKGPGDPELSALVASARAGDAAAIETLLQEFAPLLQSYLRRQAGERLLRYTGLDDLQQETLSSLVGELHRLRADATAEDFRKLLLLHAGWVVGKAGRRAARFDGESVQGGEPDAPAPAPSVGSVTRRDEEAWLTERVKGLGPEDTLVLRAFLGGASFEAIGADLGISEHAARKRYARASARLADKTRPPRPQKQ